MKKIILGLGFFFLAVIGVMAAYIFQNDTQTGKTALSVAEIQRSQQNSTEEAQVDDVNSEATNLHSSIDAYKPLSLVSSLAITPSDEFSSGTFCRFYYDDQRAEYFATFGTGQSKSDQDPGYVGGGEGGQGAAYQYFSPSLEPTADRGYYRYGGGDLATASDGEYLYHLTGAPGNDGEGDTNWRISKYDPATWEAVGQVDIDLSSQEGANDQMLVYANGQLFASSLYSENAHGADTSGVKRDPTIGAATHHHSVTTDLVVTDSWVLDDTLHANGSSLVFVDGVYQFVTTTAFFGDLMVLQYDEDWEYFGSKILLTDAQWPQGSVYDTATQRYYVAYLAIRGGGLSEARLAVFDKDWQLLSNTVVTDYGQGYFAGRPSVMLHDSKLFVTFDKESLDTATKAWNKDWQCQLHVYETLP